MKEINEKIQQDRKREIEQEANYFALALLMPRDLLKAEMKKMNFDLTSDDAIKELAKKFGVSTTALTVRISLLHLF